MLHLHTECLYDKYTILGHMLLVKLSAIALLFYSIIIVHVQLVFSFLENVCLSVYLHLVGGFFCFVFLLCFLFILVFVLFLFLFFFVLYFLLYRREYDLPS